MTSTLNSAATLALPETHYDVVRPGVAVYGLSPGPDVGTPSSLGLRPAMSLRARLALVKQVPEGQGVSYAHRYTTVRPTTLALVAFMVLSALLAIAVVGRLAYETVLRRSS